MDTQVAIAWPFNGLPSVDVAVHYGVFHISIFQEYSEVGISVHNFSEFHATDWPHVAQALLEPSWCHLWESKLQTPISCVSPLLYFLIYKEDFFFHCL